MKRRWKLLIASGMALATCSGCSSLTAHIPNKAPGIYAGVRQNFQMVIHPGRIDAGPYAGMIDVSGSPIVWLYFVTYGTIGLPFETAVDTLLLPIDLTYHEPQVRAASPPNK
jgi:uncharacterized protein YceK